MGKWSWCCTSTGQDGSKQLDLEWISPVVDEFRCPQDSRSPFAHGHANYAPIGKWPWCCTSTGQDGWIGLLVAGLWHRQESMGPYHAHEHAHYSPMGKEPWPCVPTDQDGFNELDLEWIGPLVAGLWHPKYSRSPYQAHGHVHYVPMGK